MFENINIKRFKIYNLQKKYKLLSNIIYNLQEHISTLYSYHYISLYDKNLFISYVYDIIKKINNQYNDYIINDCDSDENLNVKDKKSILYSIIKLNTTEENLYENINNFISLTNNFILNNKNKIDKYLFDFINSDPLNIVTDKIIKLSEKIGFDSIKSCIQINLSDDYYNIFDKNTLNLIDFYDKIFISTKFEITNTIDIKNYYSIIDNYENNISKEISDNSDDLSEQNNTNYNNNINTSFSNSNLFIRKIDSNNDAIISRLVELVIRRKYKNYNDYIILKGFIVNDKINVLIKTSQIANKYLYNKKKNIEKALLKTNINKKFHKLFLKHTSLYEILVFSEEDYCNLVKQYYDKYIMLINKSFMNIMKDFIKKNNNVTNMYDTIRLLLFGSDENINVAGLLYGLTKDKKINSVIIADIIYKNLSYVSQIKLKRTSPKIKEELEKIQALTMDDIDYKKQIISIKNIPINVKASAFEKIEEMKSSNNEYYKQLTFVKTIIKFPWPSSNDNKFFKDLKDNKKSCIKFMENVKDKLHNLSYGHSEAKKSLVQLVGKWITNPESSGSALSLVGPPGVGKTLLAKSISSALDIPFAQITLGGQNDGELLHGHGYTYSGSQPGMIIKKMIEAGKSRCILYFDELDKACSKHGSTNEITSILIHLTDPNMNKSFQDRFFQGIDFPLNKVIMVFSYNDSSLIDPILLDRFKEIKIKPYSLKDKIKIATDFIIPEVCNNVGFKPDDINFNIDDVEYIIDNYTLEAGVRNLKRKIESIYLRLNIDRIYCRGIFSNGSPKNSKKKIYIDRKTITDILNKPNSDNRKIHPNSEIGIINGLYATSLGSGGIVPIQIFKNYTSDETRFSFKLTGSQGDVMKESVACAFTAALEHINKFKEKYSIDNLDLYMKNKFPTGFHIHAPSGATPKDGPSAGCAFATAFVSRILKIPIRNDIAMTGEIDLSGTVSKIGGLVYKLNGAKKAGIKHVLICKQNKEDLDDIIKDNKNILSDDFKVDIINNINDIIPHALIFDSNKPSIKTSNKTNKNNKTSDKN
jgi:endopeptidase La